MPTETPKPTEPSPETQPPAPRTKPKLAPPAPPPLPVPDGEFRGIKESLKRIEEGLALLLQGMNEIRALYAENKPLIDQVKAKFVDQKSGKLKGLWPFS